MYINYIIKWKQKWKQKMYSLWYNETIDLFYMHGKQIRNVCKECRKLQQILYYEQNKEEILEDTKEYRDANRELILQHSTEKDI